MTFKSGVALNPLTSASRVKFAFGHIGSRVLLSANLVLFALFMLGTGTSAFANCTIPISAAVLNCTTREATLTAVTTAPGVSFSWTGPGIVNGANSSNTSVNLPGTYFVTVTNSEGCAGTASVEVRDWFLPGYVPALPLVPLTFKLLDSPHSYFSLIVTNAPAGSAISNGIYAAWCVKFDFLIETNILYQGTIHYPYGEDVPVHMAQFDWARINYIINNRMNASAEDVQNAIWYFSGRPEGEPLALNAVSQGLVNEALANGTCYVPQPGERMVILVDTGEFLEIQWLAFEIELPILPAIQVTKECPEGPLMIGDNLVFTGTVTNIGNVTLTNVFVVDDQPVANTLVVGPLTLRPGAGTNFTGSYIITGATNISTNIVATFETNSVAIITTNLTAVVSTNSTSVISTNSLLVFTTNNVATFTTNNTPVITTNSSPTFTTNVVAVITTNNTAVILTNITFVVTTNTSGTITTNNVVTITTNSVQTLVTNNTAPFFGTINPISEVSVDRFSVPNNMNGLTYADQDKGYAATQFYSMRDPGTAQTQFDTITAGTEAVVDRFAASTRDFDSITFAAPDVGYGPVIFYYLSHDNAGVSTFGTIAPGGAVGVVSDKFVVGEDFDSITFSATDVGYGANLFYYVRHNAAGVSTFGTIDPALPGIVTDRFTVGRDVHALVFTATDVGAGYGANNFYYLRKNSEGVSTFGTILVTGLTTATVTDRFEVGTNAHELTFTTTDVGFGPNLFYFLRGGSSVSTNAVNTFTTNTVPVFTTNTVDHVVTNQVPVFSTNNVVVFATNNIAIITTNAVITLSTNVVSVITTNNAASIVTNSISVISTNTVVTFTTNSVPSFATNSMALFLTNYTSVIARRVVPGIATDTVTATGRSIYDGLLVSDTATCSVVVQAGIPPVSYGSTNGFSFSFATVNGVSYTVQYKNSFTDIQWTDLPNMPVLSGGGVLTIMDDSASQFSRFYRVIQTP